MSVISELVSSVPIPRVVRVRQVFDDSRIDLEQELPKKMVQADVLSQVKPGSKIAIAVGSRGVNRISEITAIVVAKLREKGAEPFIVPAMGSHGGATAEGQKSVLEHLGVTEAAVKAPICSTMEVVKIGELANGLPIYVDALAAQADGIVIVNRVKPHTAFRGPVESGLTKMLSIGLGKQKGAEACHQLGFKHMAEHVPAMAAQMIAKLPVLFGIATVENAYDQVCRVEVIKAAEIAQREPALLEEAKARMPKLFPEQIDVLVVDEIGKNISGDGMDPNITGRYPTPYAHGGPNVTKMVVLGLTKETEGNANGIGTADFTTSRVAAEMDQAKTYANGLTSTVVGPTKLPMVLKNDKEALQAAIKTCNILDFTKVRLVRIKNTLEIGEIEVSEALVSEARRAKGVEIISEPYVLGFDNDGNLI